MAKFVEALRASDGCCDRSEVLASFAHDLGWDLSSIDCCDRHAITATVLGYGNAE